MSYRYINFGQSLLHHSAFCIELCKLKQFKLFNTITKSSRYSCCSIIIIIIENFIELAQVVLKMNSVIHRINHHPTDKY